jgi:hypothetical protein
LIRFAIAVVLISTLLFISVYVGRAQGYFSSPSFYIEIIAFQALVTLGFYAYLLRRISVSPQDFTPAFLLTLVLRFLLFAGFMLVIIVMDTLGAHANALFFMISYMILTVTEVAFLYRKVTSGNSSK